MAKISVITPTNNAGFYRQAKKSMLRQTEQDWEWIVLWNGNAYEASDDPRILCIPTQVGLPNVGALKREACTYVTSPYCVEFDHDDELSSDCLEKILKAFTENSMAAFVYSECAHVRSDGTFDKYSNEHGWEQVEMVFHGEQDETVIVNKTPPLLPQNISRIWYAPDHARAWRMSDYVEVGGHRSDQKTNDDQDLMIRFFKRFPAGFHHIPECLYKYRVHGQNTWLTNNREIQTKCLEIHDANIHDIARSFAAANNLPVIDLGGGIDCLKGWISCDTHDAAITADLNGTWPFPDGSVAAFRANDVIEHLKNPIHTMNEAWRSLRHGGLLLIEVPSTDGRGAFQDPTHCSWWNQNSASYYSGRRSKYVRHAGYKGRFQVIRNVTYFPSDEHKREGIPYCKIHLAAIKDGPRLHGLIEI
jgi:hypothetical protein